MEFRIRFTPMKPGQVKALDVIVESDNEETADADARHELRFGRSNWKGEVLPLNLLPRVALEMLRQVFCGNGKPRKPAEAIQYLETVLPRVEEDPENWWNRPEIAP